MHSVLFLILAFFNAAGLFVLMGAEFLAMILIVVYVGAVAVLFLFVVMMLDVDFARAARGLHRVPAGRPRDRRHLPVRAAAHRRRLGHQPRRQQDDHGADPDQRVSNTEALGLVLYTKYIHYFQLAGMVLLVAMIGAIVLTLRHKANVKRQDINVQNARTPEMAMAMRKVASGQGLQDSDAAEWVK